MKVVKKIGRYLFNTLFVIVACIMVFFIGTRILGYVPFTVLSSSMNPAYKVGDLVYAKRVKFSDIKTGDALVFKINGNTTVTHRVIKIDKEEKKFITRGDANNIADGNPVYYSDVVGVVKFFVPKLGYLSIFLSKVGYIPVIMIALATILCYEVIKKIIILKNEDSMEENYEKENL